MKKFAVLSMMGVMPLLGLLVMPASAAPVAQFPAAISEQPFVERARSDCRWVDNKWTYQKGDKRWVCRPDRPQGRGWSWHREGQRFGWYQRERRAWHHNAW